MVKNIASDIELIDLGITGQNTPIGVLEALQRLPEYVTSCEVTSMLVEMIRVPISVFMKTISSSQ